jgi:hypothetical protein
MDHLDSRTVEQLLRFSSHTAREHRLDPYHLRDIARGLQDFPGQSVAEPGFLDKLRRALVGALIRLDALPRTHSFWKDTNKRPTLGKLQDFSLLLLKLDPGDTTALWTLVALGLYGGWKHIGQAWLERLQALGALEPAGAIQAALMTSVWSTYGRRELIQLLKRTNLCGPARGELERLKGETEEWVRAWAGSVLERCKGNQR